MAGGNPREVTKTAGCKTEKLRTVLTPCQVMYQCKREQMRQVADRSKNAVMLSR